MLTAAQAAQKSATAANGTGDLLTAAQAAQKGSFHIQRHCEPLTAAQAAYKSSIFSFQLCWSCILQKIYRLLSRQETWYNERKMSERSGIYD